MLTIITALLYCGRAMLRIFEVHIRGLRDKDVVFTIQSFSRAHPVPQTHSVVDKPELSGAVTDHLYGHDLGSPDLWTLDLSLRIQFLNRYLQTCAERPPPRKKKKLSTHSQLQLSNKNDARVVSLFCRVQTRPKKFFLSFKTPKDTVSAQIRLVQNRQQHPGMKSDNRQLP